MQETSQDHTKPIPTSSYTILRCVAASTTRSLMYLANDKGHTTPYIVLQFDGQTVDGYHFSSTNKYILVKTDEDAIKAFLSIDRDFDDLFNDKESHLSDYEFTSPYETARTYSTNKQSYTSDNCLFLNFNNSASAKENLPKELEVSKINISNVTQADYAGSGLAWNKGCGDKQYKEVWNMLVNGWKTCFDSCIESLKSQLEYVQKSISSLRQKINTFDQTGSNFRNKAYSIYNKTVNSIN